MDMMYRSIVTNPVFCVLFLCVYFCNVLSVLRECVYESAEWLCMWKCERMRADEARIEARGKAQLKETRVQEM